MNYISRFKSLTSSENNRLSQKDLFKKYIHTFNDMLACDFTGLFRSNDDKVSLAEYISTIRLEPESSGFSVLNKSGINTDILFSSKSNIPGLKPVLGCFQTLLKKPVISLLLFPLAENGFLVMVNSHAGVFSDTAFKLGKIIAGLLLYKDRQMSVKAMTNQLESTCKVLSRYFSYNILNKIKEGSIDREKCFNTDITVMFVKIKGFIALSGTFTPRQSIDILNHYFRSMVNIVQQNEGTVDKYIQEKLLAYWGFPRHHQNDAVLAVLTAIAMKNEFIALKKRNYIPEELSLGIGINKGNAVLGNLGSDERMEFTIIGDTVNVAARLCEIAPEDDIIISRWITQEIFNNIRTVPFGKKVLDGKSSELNTYKIDFLRRDYFDIYLSALGKKEESGEILG